MKEENRRGAYVLMNFNDFLSSYDLSMCCNWFSQVYQYLFNLLIFLVFGSPA